MAAQPFESKIQDLVYNVETGIGIRLIKGGLYILFVLSMMLMFTANQFKGFKHAGAMEYAQIARNLHRSGTFTTKYIRPLSMWFLIERTDDGNPRLLNHPDLLHPPAYPALIAIAFDMAKPSFAAAGSAKFRPEQWVIVPLGLLTTLMTGLLMYIMARRLFDRRVALLGVTIFFLSNTIWTDAVSGLPTALAGLGTLLCLFSAALTMEWRLGGKKAPWWLLGLAASTGFAAIAFLTQYSTFVLLPGLALMVAISFKPRGWIWMFLVFALFAAFVSPWVLRNLAVSNSLFGLAPYTAFYDTQLYPQNNLDRTIAPQFINELVIPVLRNKFMKNFNELYNFKLTSLGDGVIVALFLVTFFYRFSRPAVHLFRWGVGFSMILALVTGSLFSGTADALLHTFIPVVIMYGCAFFFILLDRLQFTTKAAAISVISGLIATCALPLVLTLLPPRPPGTYPPYFIPYISHVCNMIKEQEILCTDMPWATAWYGDDNSLELPMNLNDFYDINDYTQLLSGLYLTTVSRDAPFVTGILSGTYESWAVLFHGRVPNDFPLQSGISLNNPDQFFLTDRPRWKE